MPEKTTLRIGTFNVHNLALPDLEFFEHEQHSPHEYLKKRDWIAHQLDTMRADVVAFQEIFQRQALEETLAQCKTWKEPLNLVMQDDSPGAPSPAQKVALVTPYPVEEVKFYPDIPPAVVSQFAFASEAFEKFSRPVLRCVLNVPVTGKTIFYVTHLKSKKPDIPLGLNDGDPIAVALGEARSLARRAIEAVGLRSLMLADLTPPEGGDPADLLPVVLAGDCNDGETSVTTHILTGTRPQGKMTPAQLSLAYAKYMRCAQEIHSSRSLSSAYYTYINDGEFESLDHVILSNHFAPSNPKRLFDVKYVHFLTDHLVDRAVGYEPPPPGASDHGEAVVVIERRQPPAPWPTPTPTPA